MKTPVSKFKRPNEPKTTKKMKNSHAGTVLISHAIIDAQESAASGNEMWSAGIKCTPRVRIWNKVHILLGTVPAGRSMM